MDAPLNTHKKDRKARKLNVNLLIRRIHLYSGLFLLPWVLLYGMTAFLFNHPNALSPGTRVDVPLPENAMAWTATEKLADDIVASLEQGDAVQRVGAATFNGGAFLRFGGDVDGRIFVNLAKETLETRTRPVAEKPDPSPFDGPITLTDAALTEAALLDVATAVIAEQGIDAKGMNVRFMPNLIFHLDYQGERWRAIYDTESQELSAKRVTETTGPHWRTFLLRLHTAHVYNDQPARFAWAFMVDIMALAMTVWGASGIYMWWRMKKLRGIGVAVILASITVAVLMAVGMYMTMVR